MRRKWDAAGESQIGCQLKRVPFLDVETACICEPVEGDERPAALQKPARPRPGSTRPSAGASPRGGGCLLGQDFSRRSIPWCPGYLAAQECLTIIDSG